MAIMAKDTRKEFTPAPEGLHQSVCVDVVDLGMQDGQWGPKPKVRLVWQLDQVNPETSKRFTVSQQYTLSLNEKANLRHHLEAWRGKKFSPQELQGFDLEKLLGVNGQVQVVHALSDDGRIWANVQAIVPLGKGMTKMRAEEYVRVKDRTDKPADPTANGGKPAEDDVPF
jgi:hypothetical protein